MKAILHLGCLGLCLASALLMRAAESDSMKVESSRGLRLAVVDLDRHNAASEQLRQTFAESLGFEISQRSKMPVPVKPLPCDAARAAWGVANGSFDIAVVVGGNVPSALVSADFYILKATPGSGHGKRTICLVIRQDDPGLVAMITDSFPASLKGPFFQKALARYSGDSTPEGAGLEWRFASSGGSH
jgi:hypothetical protein